ncbi:MAG: hypothetical protein ACKPKO_15840, partial [Candidatus Fonsibacter sp.]
FGFLVTFLDTRFGLLGLVVSTTSSVSSLGGTYITCSTAVLFDLFFGRAFAFGFGSVAGSMYGSGCSVCVV